MREVKYGKPTVKYGKPACIEIHIKNDLKIKMVGNIFNYP